MNRLKILTREDAVIKNQQVIFKLCKLCIIKCIKSSTNHIKICEESFNPMYSMEVVFY